jgi:hypothetical protein
MQGHLTIAHFGLRIAAKRKLLLSATVATFVALCLLQPALAGPAVEVDVGANPLVTPPDDLVFGWEFTLSQPIEISHFGLFDAQLDGFERAWQVNIWSLNPSASTVAAGLNSPDTTVLGEFRYVEVLTQLFPRQGVLLDPGHYVIAAGGLTFSAGDSDMMPSAVASISTGPGITFIQGRSGMNTGHNEDLVFPDVAEPGVLKYFGPNFRYEIIPEPASFAVLSVGVLIVFCMAMWHVARRERSTD